MNRVEWRLRIKGIRYETGLGTVSQHMIEYTYNGSSWGCTQNDRALAQVGEYPYGRRQGLSIVWWS